MKPDSIVIHYAEIALKGKNRRYFENLLVGNIKAKIGDAVSDIVKESSQLTINLSGKAEIIAVSDALKRIPGIAFFSPAVKVGLGMAEMRKTAVEMLKGRKFTTFKVLTKRHHKENNMNSMEVSAAIGEAIVKKYRKKAMMKEPDITLKVEIVHGASYISCERIKGIGGMPTDQRQKVVALLSGGFDSPVAAYMMMKRGCEVILVHFQNKNQMTSAVESKITNLASQLSKYQLRTRLYIVPFEDIQKEIIQKVNAELRMLLYRQIMLEIASAIAVRHKAKFLVVGDSLSQVASQTIENLDAVYSSSPMNIFAPLIGMDKEEIILIAKAIGTFDISSLPYGDCCSYFVPKHPMLRASPEMIKEALSRISINIGNAAMDARLIEMR